jgi:hypothetical protein
LPARCSALAESQQRAPRTSQKTICFQEYAQRGAFQNLFFCPTNDEKSSHCAMKGKHVGVKITSQEEAS